MKKFKKLAGLLLALVMVCALGVTAFAADTYTITISKSDSGYEYVAYQIFAGDLDTTGTILSNITWGSNIAETITVNSQDITIYSKLADIADGTTYPFASCTTAAAVAEVLARYADNSDVANDFADVVSAFIKDSGTQSTQSGSSYTISGLAAGYYLVKNTKVPSGTSIVYSNYILEVVANVDVDPKESTTTLDKEVGEGTTTDNEYETTANYDIGDDVPFTLIAALPSNYSSYTTYKLTFHDTLSSGLSFNNDVEVAVYTAHTGVTDLSANTYYKKAGGGMVQVDATSTVDSSATYYTKTVVVGGYTAVSGLTAFVSGTTYYELQSGQMTMTADSAPDSTKTYYTKSKIAAVTTDLTDGCTFEVQLADTNLLYDENGNAVPVSSSSLIVVTYTAKLSSSAGTTETNKANLEYSNNPNDDGSGTGKTPEDITTVFTFTLDVNKVDSDSNPLEGAKFKLYKLEEVSIQALASDTTYYYFDTNGTLQKVAENASFDSNETYYVYTMVGSEVTAGHQYQALVTLSAFESGVTYYTISPVNTSDTPVSGNTYYVHTTAGYQAVSNLTAFETGVEYYIFTEVTDTSGTPDSNTTYYVYAQNNFTFSGLAVGYYKLVESTTPAGYNTLDDLYFTIQAETEEDSSGNATVKNLKILSADGTEISSNGGTFSLSTDGSTISTDIKNTKGSVLPSTGGIGTTIFYVIGSIMVFGAVVVLITRRRMRAE